MGDRSLGSAGGYRCGGRYDGLVEHLGGRATPAIGWGIGLERVTELYRLESESIPTNAPDAYLVAVGDTAQSQAIWLAETLRSQDSELKIEVNCGGGSFKSQMKKADKSGAKIAIILGDDELSNNEVTIKYLREDASQQKVKLEQLNEFLIKNID